ncbi:MAG: response regulator [Rubrivivax sp.]|nr:MAG: response regulator [Rubrivivax sp.]
MHILLIEDDLDLGFALQRALQVDGLSSQWVRRVADAPDSFSGLFFDLVLLDLCLPDGEGLALLSRWRDSGVDVPVIVITARSALDDRLSGLEGGADDYVIKPFAMAELLSRIRVVMRRYARQASDVWHIGELRIEPRRHLACLGGVALDLSPREFRLVLALAREPGTVVQKSELAQRLDPLGDPVEFGAIEVHMSNLRRKIGAQRIKTIHGVGYMLVQQA